VEDSAVGGTLDDTDDADDAGDADDADVANIGKPMHASNTANWVASCFFPFLS
jgi:hypothetical protein